MKILIKLPLLKGDQFEVEIDPECSVRDLKCRIETARSDAGAPEQQKLMFSGKMLSDDSKICDCGLKDGDFLVCMTPKKKVEQATGGYPAASAAPVATSTEVAPAKKESKPEASAKPKAKAVPTAPQPVPIAPLKTLRIHGLQGSRNNDRDVYKLLLEQKVLRVGMRLDGDDVELIVSECTPEEGCCVQSTDITFATQVIKVFEKVHVLPFRDTYKYNFDHMYNEHMVPFFNGHQNGEFTEGFEFAYKGARFRVVAVVPDKSYGIVGKGTEIFYEGVPLERVCLSKVHVLPFEEGLPEKYKTGKFSLDDVALKRDFLTSHFAQLSYDITAGETFTISDVRFKVVSTVPAKGGGFGDDTELLCQGIALKERLPKASPKAKAKAKGFSNASASDGSSRGCAQS